MSEATVLDPLQLGSKTKSQMARTAGPQLRTYRPEVQGLRALAVLMVVAYHVWFNRISGGVDVFLLVSAFLLTGQFARKLESGERFGLIKYWIKLSRRLLPLLVVTLLGTLAASYVFLPQTRWGNILEQTWASLLYYQNWFLASQAVDYYAADHSAASPLQHFWSLSIQGQIFVLWPVIFAVVAVLVRVFRLSARPLLIWVFSGIFMVSLTFSIATTQSNQTFAYFDTRARLWEFALGSLLALLLPYLRLSHNVRLFLGWFGVAAMLGCGLVLQVGQQFPGYMALWPTLAAGCIIAAGSTRSRFGADKFLSSKPLVRLGDSSYALYLVHWPVLVIYLVAAGQDRAGAVAGLVIVLGSIFAAWAMTRFVDAPLRRSRWLGQGARRSLLVTVVCLANVAVPLTVWQQNVGGDESLLTVAGMNNPGAAAFLPGYVDEADPNAPLRPSFSAVDGDWPKFPSECTTVEAELINRCDNGMEGAVKNVVVLGSSHAHVFNTILLDMAAENSWSLISITRGNCPLSTDPAEGVTAGCADFNGETLEEVLGMKPDVVVTTSTRTSVDSDTPERLDPSWVTAVKTLNDAGIPVVAVRDTPRFMQSVPVCLENNPENHAACGASRDELFSPTAPTATAAALLPQTSFLDLSNSFCDAATCPAVVGNVIVYKDDNHVTGTYLRTLRPVFERKFLAATGWELQQPR